jgi:hypothetical protein
MKNSRPSLILICWAAMAVAAQGQGPPGVAGQGDARQISAPSVGQAFRPDSQARKPEQPQALLERVRLTLDHAGSLSMKVRMQIDSFDQQGSGTGDYLQKRDGAILLSRFTLKCQFGKSAFTISQINSGRWFWICRQLREETSLSKLDMERIDETARTRGTSERSFKPGQLPVGGFPKLVAGMQQNFQFSQLGETQFASGRVWVLDGSWRPERLMAAVPDQRSAIEAGRPIDLKKLPAHLPEHVVLFIGQSDLLPYRIDYLRRSERAGGAGEGSLLPGYRAMQTIEFFGIRVNESIDSREFQYQPPQGVKVTDATDEYLRSVATPAVSK